MKKLCSLLVCLAMLICTCSAFGVHAAAGVEDVNEQLSVLRRLHIVPNDFGTVDDTAVTKAEYAYMVAGLLGLSDLIANSGYDAATDFVDLYETDAKIKAVKLLAQLGIVSGDGKGYFYPQQPIVLAEAVTLLVKALGYDEMAKSYGGYSVGYLAVGQNLGLMKKLTGHTNTSLSKAQAVALLYDSLEVEVVSANTIADDGVVYQVSNKTALSGFLNLEVVTGIVTANEITALNGAPKTPKNYVKIDGTLYYAGQDFYYAKDYLGYSVTVYYRTEGSDRQIAAILQNKFEQLLLQADEIISVQDGVVTYARDGAARTQKVNLQNNSGIIFNGHWADVYGDAHLMPATGSVRCIDSTGNGDYDLIVVQSYQTYVVDTVNLLQEEIHTKSPVAVTLELEAVIDENQLTNKSGAYVSIGDIQADQVIAAARNMDGTLVSVVLCGEELNGTVTEVETGSGVAVIWVDDTAYKASSVLNRFPDVGDAGRFILDLDGRIANIIKESSDGLIFGYLMRAVKNNTIDGGCRFMILTPDNAKKIYTTTETVLLNDIPVAKDALYGNSYLFAADGSTREQAIQFSVNHAGSITKLITPLGTEPAEEEAFYEVPMEGTSVDALYVSSTKTFRFYTFLNEDTKVFRVPMPDEAIAFDPDNYEAKPINAFTNMRKYNIKAYHTSKKSPFASVIVDRYNINSAGELDKNVALTVVDKITDALNAEGENTHILYGLKEGVEVKVPFQSDEILNRVILYGEKLPQRHPIEQGDVIRYETDSATGAIDNIELIYDESTKTYYGSATASVQSNGFAGEVSTYYLKAIGRKEHQYINMESMDPRSFTTAKAYIWPMPKFKISVYENINGKVEVRAGTAEDVVTAQEAGDEHASIIVGMTKNGSPTSAIIYNYH